jgi:AraC family transcriptional regulator of adaptative response/methylated-DNA-[protein]-cysteine methyltransferase
MLVTAGTPEKQHDRTACASETRDGRIRENVQTSSMHSLHRLAIASDEEARARGAGMVIRAGITESPFGPCLIADSPRGVCRLSFIDTPDKKTANAELREVWPMADVLWEPFHVRKLAAVIFKSGRKLSVYVAGTDFQMRVWSELMRIPAGGTISYGKLAAAIGNPNASRATGSAVGANPVSFLIPCHRVIRANGETGRYRWGAARKKAMLEWEANHTTSSG